MKLIIESGKPKLDQDGFKSADYLEWWSAVASMRETNVNLIRLKERLKAP